MSTRHTNANHVWHHPPAVETMVGTKELLDITDIFLPKKKEGHSLSPCPDMTRSGKTRQSLSPPFLLGKEISVTWLLHT